MTDEKKVLFHLKEAGETGVHSFILNKLVGTTRSAARVNGLKAKGYAIESKPERLGDSLGVRYFLRSNIDNSAPQKPIRWEFRGNTAVPVYEN